ncbi:Killer toxin subunits alpha/beta [Tolypocladium paradoxum]|uniref:Killer toxin subunits alpha/beta n=1 Tax=Tolypocladium paradoxum TaxID=94208 RepID=A0A2S4L046_9HYPO|nr:Killer toxin subunits alpha/beta [Tolypocladium paradoxum]
MSPTTTPGARRRVERLGQLKEGLGRRTRGPPSPPSTPPPVEVPCDVVSDSNILIYGDDRGSDWVAYMDGEVKAKRIDWIRGLNFAGTSDWAIDLQEFTGDSPGDGDNSGGGLDIDLDHLKKLGCDPTMNPGNMQALLDKINDIPGICHDHINDRLIDFMKFGDGKGNKYFKCHWTYQNVDESGPCAGMPHFWDYQVSYSVGYELTDENGFYDALNTELGIEKNWVKFGQRDEPYSCDTTGDDYWRQGQPTHPCRRIYHKRSGFPMRGDKNAIKVGDPKAVIEAAMPNITALQTTILAAYGEVALKIYRRGGEDGDESDPAVAASMPIFQLEEAVENMKEIKDIGEKAQAEKKKNLIVLILGIVLLVIPFVGETLGPLVGSAAQVARIAMLISEVGNAALTIADIFQDPTSAPFAILNLVVGGGGGADKLSKPAAFQKASKVRDALKATQLAKFSQSSRDKDALVQKLVKTCARK